MKRLPPSLRRTRLALPLLAVALLASPVLSAQGVNQRYDPANVNQRNIADPRFQRQMTQSAQSVAEGLVGRRANATDQRILSQFTDQQTQLLQKMQNASDAMPDTGAGAGYRNAGVGAGGNDQRAMDELSRSPEGRYVLEQMARERSEQARSAYPQNGYRQDNSVSRQGSGYPQNGYPQQNAYPQNNGYPPQSPYSQGGAYNGYPPQNNGYPPAPSTGRAIGGALLQDITNAAIQRSIQPKVIYVPTPAPRR